MPIKRPTLWPESADDPEPAPDDGWYAIVYVDGAVVSEKPHWRDLAATESDVEAVYAPADGGSHLMMVDWRRSGQLGTVAQHRWKSTPRGAGRRAQAPVPAGPADVAGSAMDFASGIIERQQTWLSGQLDRERAERHLALAQVEAAHVKVLDAYTRTQQQVADAARAEAEARRAEREAKLAELETRRLQLEEKELQLRAMRLDFDSAQLRQAAVAPVLAPVLFKAGGAIVDAAGGIDGLLNKGKELLGNAAGGPAKAEMLQTVMDGLQGLVLAWRGFDSDAPSGSGTDETVDAASADPG